MVKVAQRLVTMVMYIHLFRCIIYSELEFQSLNAHSWLSITRLASLTIEKVFKISYATILIRKGLYLLPSMLYLAVYNTQPIQGQPLVVGSACQLTSWIFLVTCSGLYIVSSTEFAAITILLLVHYKKTDSNSTIEDIKG